MILAVPEAATDLYSGHNFSITVHSVLYKYKEGQNHR